MEFDAFEIVKSPQEYVPFEMGERHGSCEWSWSRKYYGGLTRFIVVALTPSLELRPRRCRLEVWMGAHSDDEPDERFGRYLVARWDAVDPEKSDEEPLKTRLSIAVSEASERANVLAPGDLPTLGVTMGTARTAGEKTKIGEVGEPPGKLESSAD